MSLHIIYAQVFSAAYTENLKANHDNESAIYLAKRTAAAACDAFNVLYGERCTPRQKANETEPKSLRQRREPGAVS